MDKSGSTLRVAAIFESGVRVRPVWFELDRRRHIIMETTLKWESRSGLVWMLHYAVSDGEALYELVYDTARQRWSIGTQEPV